MTIEEAIKNRERCLEYLEGCPSASVDPDGVEAVRMSIVALRAQKEPAKLDRSRWEGCEMCNRTYRPPEWNGGGSHDFRVSQNALFYHDSKYGWEGIEVKFCPMCGKPLTEEAWAEMERRLNL